MFSLEMLGCYQDEPRSRAISPVSGSRLPRPGKLYCLRGQHPLLTPAAEACSRCIQNVRRFSGRGHGYIQLGAWRCLERSPEFLAPGLLSPSHDHQRYCLSSRYPHYHSPRDNLGKTELSPHGGSGGGAGGNAD